VNRVETAPRLSRIIKFGVFEVNLDAGELRKSGMRQKLGGQPFEVLRLLVEHPQEIVTREELQQHIWPGDTFVDYDLALKKAVNRIREVLGDSADSPRFIETIPRRGYRFIAPITGNGHDATMASRVVPVPVATRHNPWIAGSAIAGAALLFVLLGIFAFDGLRSRFRATRPPQIRSLAVLPLRSLSPDPNQEYFSDALTDELITDLAQISSLKVISHTSTRQYEETKKTLPEIARELNVDGIIEGTVQRSGDRVRITAQLIHGPSDQHVWANTYEGSLRDVFALERDVSSDIAGEVRARVKAPNPATASQASPITPKALDLYLQGSYYVTKGEGSANDDDKKKAAEYFQQVIDIEPGFVPAYIGLANAHDLRMLGSSEDVAVQRKAAEKALALDPNSSEALEILASLRWFDFEWSGAEQQFRQAIRLNPSNASAHDYLGTLLGATGHLDEALREGMLAQELDPNANHLSVILCMRGEYDDAIVMLREMAKSHPEDGLTHYDLYRALAQKGAYEEAVEELAKTMDLFGSEFGSKLRHAFATSGYSGAMRKFAEELEGLQTAHRGFFPENLAVAYAALGDKDRAFYWLGQAYEHREMVSHDFGLTILKVDPLLASLRSDSRFRDLLRRVGLPQ